MSRSHELRSSRSLKFFAVESGQSALRSDFRALAAKTGTPSPNWIAPASPDNFDFSPRFATDLTDDNPFHRHRQDVTYHQHNGTNLQPTSLEYRIHAEKQSDQRRAKNIAMANSLVINRPRANPPLSRPMAPPSRPRAPPRRLPTPCASCASRSSSSTSPSASLVTDLPVLPRCSSS